MQVLIRGLFGLSIGWVEGIEFNFMGAVAGIDVRRPALKLRDGAASGYPDRSEMPVAGCFLRIVWPATKTLPRGVDLIIRAVYFAPTLTIGRRALSDGALQAQKPTLAIMSCLRMKPPAHC